MRRRMKTFPALALLIFALVRCDTERNTPNPDLHYFVKYYGGDGNQEAVDMVGLNDGTFVLLGYSTSSSSSGVIYMARVGAEGEVLWERMYNEFPDTHARDIEPTVDGNFVVLCDLETTDATKLREFMLLKISPDGEILNSVVHGTIANDFSRTVTPLNDGGFLVSGSTELTETWADVNNPDPDLGDVFNFRFDQNFVPFTTSAWSPVVAGFGGKYEVGVKTFERLIPASSPAAYEYYVFGQSNAQLQDTNPNKFDGLLYFQRATAGGQVSVNFPGNLANHTEIHFVGKVPPELGSGYLVVGTSEKISGNEFFLARLRENLTFNPTSLGIDFVFYNTIPLTSNIRGVAAADAIAGQPGFLLLGNEVQNTTGDEILNIWLSKIDETGRILWSSTFGSEAEDDWAAAVTELPDGKIVVLGTMGLADNQTKIAFIKLNPGGQLLE